jgi:hypothetical protein
LLFFEQRLQKRCYDMLLQLHKELNKIQTFQFALELSEPKKLGATARRIGDIDDAWHVSRLS